MTSLALRTRLGCHTGWRYLCPTVGARRVGGEEGAFVPTRTAAPPPMAVEVAVEFRNRLRAARTTALADGEGYFELIQAIEEFGGFMASAGRGPGLGHSLEALIQLFPNEAADSFSGHFRALVRARNDAAHLGAAARRITVQATDVALMLEEALMAAVRSPRAEHYMVEGVVCAEGWHTIAMVRRTMLQQQFSALPLRKEKKWFLVTDSAVVRFVAGGGQVRTTLDDAGAGLALVPAVTAVLDTPVEELRREDNGLVLVLDGDHLRGVIAPFDLL